MLFAVMFLFFIVLNGRLTLEVALVGAVVCALADLLACKVLGWSIEKSKKALRLLPDIISYACVLVWEIIKANIAVIKVILDPAMKELDPIVFTLNSRLKDELSRTILADSITITPGTYTVATDDEKLTIHCLGDSFYLDEMQLVFQKRLVAIQEREEKK